MEQSRKIAVFVACISLTVCASAQNPFRERFEQFSKDVRSQYEGFRRECNERYAEYMKNPWVEINANPVMRIPKEEWSVPIEYNEKTDTLEHNRHLPVSTKPVFIPEPEPQPGPVEPLKPSNPIPGATPFDFDYFGTRLSVSAFDSMKFEMKGACDEQTVTSFWIQFFSGEYDRLLSDMLRIRTERCLCDWAYMQLLDHFSTAFLGGGNESTLLFFFLLSQSGYMTRLGCITQDDEEMLCILFCTDAILPNMSNISIGDDVYYVYSDYWVESMSIFPMSYYDEERPVSFTIARAPILAADYYRRTLNGSHLSVTDIKINRNVADFYKTYPVAILNGNGMTQWALKASVEMEHSVVETLYPALRSAIAGRPEYEAVSVILSFLQTALTYRKDDFIWGFERAFFNEETLFYPYCDCEDRAILFSRIIRDVVGLDVVLVFYPGHLAAAVEFSSSVNGDYVMYEDRKFTICDPTYIHAGIGRTMVGCDNAEATLILVR